MQVLCKFYASFIAISLFCGLLAIHDPAWAQIYSHGMAYSCGGQKWPVFDLPPLLSIPQRIDSSSFVFEGKVVAMKNIVHNEREYTCATIAVKKIFKGDFLTDTVEVLSYYGRNLQDKRAQYIGGVRMYEYNGLFFVNQNKVFDTSLQSGRLRFRLAFLNSHIFFPGTGISLGSATTYDEVAIIMGTCREDCFPDEEFIEETVNHLKKMTGKCIDIEKDRKKKAKAAAKKKAP